jgi:hypothetical protein
MSKCFEFVMHNLGSNRQFPTSDSDRISKAWALDTSIDSEL